MSRQDVIKRLTEVIHKKETVDRPTVTAIEPEVRTPVRVGIAAQGKGREQKSH